MTDFKFDFKRNQTSKISRDKMVLELEKTAKTFNYSDFTKEEFEKRQA